MSIAIQTHQFVQDATQVELGVTQLIPIVEPIMETVTNADGTTSDVQTGTRNRKKGIISGSLLDANGNVLQSIEADMTPDEYDAWGADSGDTYLTNLLLSKNGLTAAS